MTRANSWTITTVQGIVQQSQTVSMYRTPSRASTTNGPQAQLQQYQMPSSLGQYQVPAQGSFCQPVVNQPTPAVYYPQDAVPLKQPARTGSAPSNPQAGHQKRERKAIPIIDPKTRRNINEGKGEESTSPVASVTPLTSGGRSTPTQQKGMGSPSTPVQNTTEVLRKVNIILNKLTSQKFETLMQQMKDLRIDTQDRLVGTVNLIYERAINDPILTVVCANMCRRISGTKVQREDKPGEFVTFRKILLNRCQKEFEKDKTAQLDLGKMQHEIDEAPVEKKQLLEDAKTSAFMKAKRRALGNIRFIGELFKVHMLTEAIMHSCLTKQIQSNDEDNLECFCQLLSITGKELDHKKAKQRMEQYFTQMQNIVDQKRACSRVRFMLQEIIELRQNNWMTGNEKKKFHNEAQRETREKWLQRGSRPVVHHVPKGEENDWIIHPNKMNHTKLIHTKLNSRSRPRFVRYVDDDSLAGLLRKVRSILNKLTPQKFKKLTQQMNELRIDTQDRLEGIVNLIFERAIDEPDFSVLYANLCKCMSRLTVPGKDKPVTFRKILLNRCQKEFQEDTPAAQLKLERMRQDLDKAPQEKKEALKKEVTLAERKATRRAIGNIVFIGELFKLKMLTEAIMHSCLKKLIQSNDDQNYECCGRLLYRIGKELDHKKAKIRMDQYFAHIQRIVDQKGTCSRVRFVLQDIIDLRQNKWVPERPTNMPMTIEEIHKEAQREAQEKQLQSQQAFTHKKQDGGERKEARICGLSHSCNIVHLHSNRHLHGFSQDDCGTEQGQ